MKLKLSNQSRHIILLIVITTMCLIPFMNKAFHIDDTLFIWTAKHIQNHPTNFFGFNVNWYGFKMAMYDVMKNPPFLSYYLSLVGWLFGFSEYVLHLALLLPAILSIIGIYYLAQKFCSQAMLAALMALFTPLFILSATTVMCDITMLMFWVWTILLWIQGLKKGSHYLLFTSGIFLALCSLTKYYGIVLIPLLIVYSLLDKNNIKTWPLFLLIPVSILSVYQWITHKFYGRGLLLDAASYSTNIRFKGGFELFSKGLTGLAFTGGCIIIALFILPLFWSRRAWIFNAIFTILFIIIAANSKKIGSLKLVNPQGIKWGLIIQLYLLSLAGINILGLSFIDLTKHRDAEAVLLFLWIIGTFIFASYINWTINARSILPMLPAVIILIVRQFESMSLSSARKKWYVVCPLIMALIVALMVSWADYSLANTARKAATEISKKFINNNRTVWFQGHWGFQYYMEENGAKAYDFNNPMLKHNDILIIPLNNSNVSFPKGKYPVQIMRYAPFKWLSTLNITVGAGFYADVFGPLPFAIGKIPAELYYIYLIKLRNVRGNVPLLS